MKLIRLSFLFLPILLSGCFDDSRSEDKVASVSSPSGHIDAVLVEENGGVTTSFGYQVFVVPHGEGYKGKAAVASFYGAFRNESAYGVNLKWRGDQTLVMEFLDAKSATSDSQIVVGGKRVKLILKKWVNDPKAPAGGMLYNLNPNATNG